MKDFQYFAIIAIGIIIFQLLLQIYADWKIKQKDRENKYLSEKLLATETKNTSLKKEVEELSKTKNAVLKVQQHMREKIDFFESLYHNLDSPIIKSRQWLLDLLTEAITAKDNATVEVLKTKRNPAIKAAEKLTEAQAEKRALFKRAKQLEYQLKTYEEYFPFLVDYQIEILNDEIKPANDMDLVKDANTRKKSIASFNSDELREKVQKEIKHQYPELADKIFNTTPITLGRGDDKYYFELDLLDCNVRLQFHQSPTSNIFGSMVSMQQKNKVYREHDLYRVTSNLLMARRYFQSQSRGYLYILFNKQYPMDDKYEIENEIDHITWGLSQIDIPHKILSSPSEVSNAILNDFQ